MENGTGRVSPTQRSYLTGTFAYRAPELLRGDAPTPKADIYSFGVTLWQMASGEAPYSGQNQHVVVFGVVAYNLRPELSSSIVGKSSSIINSEQKYVAIYRDCWGAKQVLRPSADAVKNLFLELKKDWMID